MAVLARAGALLRGRARRAAQGAGLTAAAGGGGRRALVCEWNIPFYLDVARRLAEAHGWTFPYWIGWEGIGPAVAEALPDAVFHDNYDAVRALPAAPLASLPPRPPDEALLRQLAFQESHVLRMMERMDPGDAFLHAERVRHYHRLLGYWDAVLEHVRPDLAAFAVPPHLVYDYVLYHLCRLRGVATVMVSHTGMEDLLLAFARYEEGPPQVPRLYAELSAAPRPVDPVALSPAAEKYLAGVNGPYEGAQPSYVGHFAALGDREEEHEMQLTRLAPAEKFLEAWRIERMRNHERDTLPPPQTYMKRPGVPPERSRETHWQYHARRRAAMERKQRWRRAYEAMAREPDLEVPFVFLPLHFQPESTTAPLGDAYQDQMLLVRLVASCLPAGWVLYVKENATQFNHTNSGELSRDEVFYEDLASVPGVCCVPLARSPFDLIDRARAVATVTGTAGWEAVVRGVPALCLGHAWYRHCHGVFQVRSRAEVQAAFLEIEGGFRPDAARVRLFLHVLERVGFRGYVDPFFEERVGIPARENVQRLSDVLEACVAEQLPPVGGGA